LFELPVGESVALDLDTTTPGAGWPYIRILRFDSAGGAGTVAAAELLTSSVGGPSGGPDASLSRMMALPGARLHPLRGERAGQRSISISGNWRVIFEFEGRDVTNVDLVDYH
jgi:hypothetical protein